MNPQLELLHSYPFEKLAALKQGVKPPENLPHISLSIGEPKHPAPEFVKQALINNLGGLSVYPVTNGMPALRQAIAGWLCRRFKLPSELIHAETQVLPVNGTREALFSFVQAVVDRNREALVVSPNPFYQIYEGAAILAGAQPWYLNCTRDNGFTPDFDSVPEQVWRKCQVLFLCSPGNPTGAVLSMGQLRQAIELAEKYDFVIASDECYSELYTDESDPPPGLLQACFELGSTDFSRCLVFHSLSKRSNLPGMRSGFVAGDRALIGDYYRYRTYHGCAMPPPIQLASISAWNDEEHVRQNRSLYREKFATVTEILDGVLQFEQPRASFYMWPETPIDDTRFARELFAKANVTVLPGQYLSRETDQGNPGRNFVRMALVAELDDCIAAATRIRNFVEQL